MALADISLDDRYDLDKSRVLLTGIQAIIRALMMQHVRDVNEGHNTAAYVSGYRGSPLGGVDQQFSSNSALLAEHNITFQPGLNEDLAATAIWGAQQAEMRGEGRYDGVCGVWYGKGPGVDRSGDVFRHANLAGTSKLGGVLAMMGDDHTCESSTTAHQSEYALVDAMMPILNPAGVQELVDYAILGWGLSRYSGCWTGLKCVKDAIESTAVIDGDLNRIKIKIPQDFDMPEGGLNIRVSDPPLAQEERLHNFKLEAARAFARANEIDKIVMAGGKAPKIGIVSTGKSYLDVRQALDELGIDEVLAARMGLRLYKIGMVWPLEPEGIKSFAKGLDQIIVVEEKRGLIERQIKDILYGIKNPPGIIGKHDETGTALFPSHGALDPNHIALEVGKRAFKGQLQRSGANRLKALEEAERAAHSLKSVAKRGPYFCAGCPHNSSTVIPEGARAYAGIGCHWMVQLLDRNTEGYTHMGGEGANWIGEALHSTRKHVFQNIGDGTYNHSGSLAIRAARAAGTDITFKILFNDAVAMTGGQKLDGDLSVATIAKEVLAEGVGKLAVVSDEPEKYKSGTLPKEAKIHHRDDLNLVQLDFEKTDGVSVIIYDQTCAAEKRRRRKRGTFPDPDKRIFINELVCEGCGDCSAVSNCLAIIPAETEFGRKRQIDQSSCNKDFSCLKGFCPSFVTVHGGKLRVNVQTAKSSQKTNAFVALPEPRAPDLRRPFSGIIAGIGGTGVVTISALLGMAAHLEGKACGIIDMAGLAQKGGAVLSHIKIAQAPEDIQAIRVAAEGADFLLGCDLVVAGSAGVLALLKPGQTKGVINSHEAMPSDFTQNADYQLPTRDLHKNITQRMGAGENNFLEASALAVKLTGDSIAANLLLLGFAYQKGQLPVGSAAIEQAIRLNGVGVDSNIDAFRWGRRAAHDLSEVRAMAGGDLQPKSGPPEALDDLIEFYVNELTAYQNQALGQKYRALVEQVRTAEQTSMKTSEKLTRAVAQSYFKLLAYKDEYEVARLFTDGRFAKALAERFEEGAKLEFHMAPPILSRHDRVTGHAIKRRFGAWMMPALRIMAALKDLRGTYFDIFGTSQERKQDRQLIADYENLISDICTKLMPNNLPIMVEIASMPQKIRGFGHVRDAAMKAVQAKQAALLKQLQRPQKTTSKKIA